MHHFQRVLLFGILLILAGPSVDHADAVLLQEDFDDGVADGFTVLDPIWTVVDGTYLCRIEGASQFSLSSAGDHSWGDYRVRCDLKVSGSLNQVLVFRLQDRYNFYDVNLRGYPFDDVVLTKVVQGRDTWHASAYAANSIGYWHTLAVEVEQNRIGIEVDGVPLIEHVDDTDPYLTGGIAVCGYAGGEITWQNARFDNVIVEKTDAVATDETRWDQLKALYR